MSLRTGSVAGGLAVMGMGAACLTLGLMRSPLLPPRVLGGTGAAMAGFVGFLLVVGGLLLAIFTFRQAPEPAPVVPAHVAFMTRTSRPIAVPDRAVVPPPRARVRSRPAPEQAAVSKLDDEIRELTRRINKAGVMLATGQISHQGYATYVDDLKKQRGALEASRVRIEMRNE